MKTKMVILISFIVMVFIGCNSVQPESLEKKIVSSIVKECEITFKVDTTFLGDILYEYYLTNDNFMIVRKKAKKIISRELNILPSKSEERKVSWEGDFYDLFEWETPQIKVVMEIIYKIDEHKLRIWITNE